MNTQENSLGVCKFCKKFTREGISRENGSILMWVCLSCFKTPQNAEEINKFLMKDDRKENFGRN